MCQNIPLCVFTVLFFHSSADGYLGCSSTFGLWWVMLLWTFGLCRISSGSTCSYLGYVPKSGIAGSYGSVQFSSVSQLCLTLCDPMDCSMPGIPVHHQLPELTQTHVHRVGDAMQPSHPLSSPSPTLLPSIVPSTRVFSKESVTHQVAKVLEFQLQHQSFQWTFRTDFL